MDNLIHEKKNQDVLITDSTINNDEEVVSPGRFDRKFTLRIESNLNNTSECCNRSSSTHENIPSCYNSELFVVQ